MAFDAKTEEEEEEKNILQKDVTKKVLTACEASASCRRRHAFLSVSHGEEAPRNKIGPHKQSASLN